MVTCSYCDGFLPAEAASCPNCASTVSKRTLRAAKQLAKVGAAAATMMTLMACYGMAHRLIETPQPSANDRDGDGYEPALPGAAPSPAFDCDDTSASVHPGANDPAGDALDQNCDGMDGASETPAPTATMAVEPPAETKPPPPAIAK